MSSNRIDYIDLAKGISICLVMLFHIKGIKDVSYDPIVESVLFSSCMVPPFFFIAGAFFREGDGFRKFLIKKVNSLLVPFVFFYLMSAVIIPNLTHQLFGMNYNTVLGWESLWAFIWPGEYPNVPLWFLWCLFLTNLLFWAIHRLGERVFPNHARLAILGMVSCCAVMGFYFAHLLNADIGNLCNTLKYVPIFFLGHIMAEKDMFRKLDNSRMEPLRKGLILLVLIGIIALTSYFLGETDMNLLRFYVYGIAGSFTVIILASWIVRLPLISYLGRYSIILLLTHGILLRIGTPFVIRASEYIDPYYTALMFWVIMALSYLVIIPLAIRFLPHVTAQKQLFDPEDTASKAD